MLIKGVSGGDDSLYGILCKHLESRTSKFSASESSRTIGQLCENSDDHIMPVCSHELEMYDTASTSNNPLDKYDLADENFKSRDTLHSLVQSSFSCRHKPESSTPKGAKTSRNPYLSMAARGSQVGKDSFDSRIIKLCYVCQLEKKPQSPPNESVCISSNNVTPERVETTKKRRITWTHDLHEQFCECVNRLGGAKKATPKAILKLMNCYELSISNVKSHLQKYRVTCDVTVSPKDAVKTEGSPGTNSFPAHAPETCPQILEALKLQISVQQSLYEQLEIQRSLQLRIEEQAKQLREMFDRQAETNKNFQHSA
ncbi:PREDICTED: protein PHOSPHATE STARVATION RESPONSE 1-like [Nicotiana attenuata]|uniref:Myb family transcription factor phl5 n=1 Tax=Nicotiana attenuata TaxID=49451 RepID=A0A314LC38_NICAT|nr:PREDICTED: protein PHOSPHATE STARVATION RESPONSE 1-like [Nicotiana attenuata]OIT39176.1 myb family transcription factor phl5 [Nicotiana attenuata]